MAISNQEHEMAHSKMEQDADGIVHMAEQDESEGHYDIRDRFIISSKKAADKFDHTEFSKWLVHESGEHFATMIDSDRVYYYQDGIYVEGGEAKIVSMVEEVMGGYLMTVRNRNEVIGHIRALTHTDRIDFDVDTDVINMQNGLYHINNESFTQHTPKYLSLSKMPVKYDPDATCPVIDAFIKDVVAPHRIDAIYEIAGYAIMPRKKLKRGVIFVGQPDTGKSTLISLIAAFVGESRVSDVSPLVIGNDAHATFDLYGMFLNRIDDLGKTTIIETGLLKSLVSSKPIRANPKFGKPFSFTPTVFELFGCNNVPECTDLSMMDKFDIFMFTNLHQGKDIDIDLDDKITSDEELSGLFNKAIVGVKVAIKNRTFTGSFTFEDRKKQYIYLSNPIARFVDECCTMDDPEAMITKKLFRKAYVEWSKEQNIAVVKVEAQTTYLQDQGVMLSRAKIDDVRDYYYTGVDISYGCPNVSNLSKPCPSRNSSVFQEQQVDSAVSCPSFYPIVGSMKKQEEYSQEVQWGLDVDTKPSKQYTDNEKPHISDLDTVGHTWTQTSEFNNHGSVMKQAVDRCLKRISDDPNGCFTASEISLASNGRIGEVMAENMLKQDCDVLGVRETSLGWTNSRKL